MPLPFPSSHWGGFSPSALFAHGEQGCWYDPTDLSSMYQDSAGTTPVTAVEQPVGRILDKSGRGNHVSQSTSSARPVLSARVNLLTKTEQFDDAAWTKNACTVTADATTAPDGTLTADKEVESATTAFHYINRLPTIVSGNSYTYSVYVKAAERYKVAVYTYIFTGSEAIVNVNLSTGAIMSATANGTNGVTSTSLTDVGNGWYRVSITGTSNASGVGKDIGITLIQDSQTTATSYAGNGTSGIYVWGADLRLTNQGVGLPYQRVNTATDYVSAGFPLYLAFDGVDDYLSGSDSNMPTGNLSIFASSFGNVDYASNVYGCIASYGQPATGQSILLMFGTSTSPACTNAMLLSQYGDIVSVDNYTRKGAVASLNRTSTTYNLRLNGGANSASKTMTTATAVQGTNGLAIGSQNVAVSYQSKLNGRIYGVIIRGASTSTPQLTATENWLRLLSKAY